MDNTGNYITYGDLLLDMSLAENTKVIKSKLTLSNVSTDPSGDTFDFVKANVGDQDPAVGDVITQAGETSCIIDIPAAGKLKVEDTGKIFNGPADLLHSESIPKKYGERLIQEAMQFIDEKTGQYFNKKTGIFQIEGNNTPLMHLPVPIIDITEFTVNSADTPLTEGEDYDFVAFKGRQNPQDDRRNPRIKLNFGRGRNSIYSGSLTSRAFMKGTFATITGSFGFLEPDGTTPLMIQRAVKLLVMKEINNQIGESASSTSGTGPLKRLKVDLHEQEFFELSQNKDSSRSSSSGDAEVDRIIATYRTPIRISGSFKILRANEDGSGNSDLI